MGAKLFKWCNPKNAEEWSALHRFANDSNIGLVIIDGLANCMASEGLNEDVAADCLTWSTNRADPFKTSGAAVVIADHVAKSSDSRGRWSRGSGAKLGAYKGAVWEIKTGSAFDRNTPGHVKFILRKDNEGGAGLLGRVEAELHFTPTEDGNLGAEFREPSPELSEKSPKRMSVMAAKSHGQKLASERAWKLAEWIQVVQHDTGRTATNFEKPLKDFATSAEGVVIDIAKCGKSQPKLIGPRDDVTRLKLELEREHASNCQKDLNT
jgi:hypothetical protein